MPCTFRSAGGWAVSVPPARISSAAISDRVPSDPVSIAVALADKLDTLVGFWAIDEKPTGSKDPFALRRAALGVIRLILDRGLRLLDDELSRLPEGADLPGEAAFKLYDTYGFPLDLTQDALREQGRGVEVAGFDAAMAEQKAKARAA